jgi:outer membrane lipoprotein-sorting protein
MKCMATLACGLLAAALLSPALAQDNEAKKLFLAMEKKIAEAKAFKVAVVIDTKGETKDMVGSYKGFLVLTEDNKARLQVSGVDFGEVRRWEMVSNGKQLKLRPFSLGVPETAKDEATLPAPKTLHRDLVRRISSLGVFLNLGPALSAVGMEAAILGKLDISNFKAGAAEIVGGRDAQVVRYKIKNNDAAFTVWIDTKTLLPLKRVIQTKRMGTITETYKELTLDPKIEAGAFELTFPANDAEKLFRAMQAKINEANAIQAAFDVELKANGEVAKGKGSLLFTKENEARFKMTVDEKGKEVTTAGTSDGKRMKFAKSPEAIAKAESDPTPKELHSLLATMVSGPGLWLTYEGEYLNGAAAGFFKFAVEGIRLVAFEAGAPEKVGGRDAKVVSYLLAGLPGVTAYHVTVWIDAQTWLPLKRTLVPVGFESGRITETCEFTLNPKIDAKAFELPK